MPGIDQGPFQEAIRLGENAHIWLKDSGSERSSELDPPYADPAPFAAELVELYPNRTTSGSDWRHPSFRAAPPDDRSWSIPLPI
ncbi:amidohydrolase family protein [Thioclava nitratireducens]|uniref:amidohydrolase family protein n=1 Tax=Thioclava nitratireducens TaxID=1915078 RepID=UPI0012FD041B|nr:amidohydrolase family protein [Thioclava nitratireducens]